MCFFSKRNIATIKKKLLLKMCKLGDCIAISVKSFMDECIAMDGRPYCGCAISWKLTLKIAVVEIKCTYVVMWHYDSNY